MQASYAAGLLLAGLGRSALIDPLAGAPHDQGVLVANAKGGTP
jgi:hypothetical protein